MYHHDAACISDQNVFFCYLSVGHRGSEVWSGWERSWPCATKSQGYWTTDRYTFRTNNKL